MISLLAAAAVVRGQGVEDALPFLGILKLEDIQRLKDSYIQSRYKVIS